MERLSETRTVLGAPSLSNSVTDVMGALSAHSAEQMGLGIDAANRRAAKLRGLASRKYAVFIARSAEEWYGPSMQRSAGEIRARRRTRRAVMTAYYAVVALFIVIAAGNVTWQIWAPRFRHHAPTDCGVGLDALKRAVQRARQAAGELSEASEDAALARFREALLPEWDQRDAIAASCESNAELARALDVVERLRYAEERAVRREVSELAPLRRRVEQLRTSPPHP